MEEKTVLNRIDSCLSAKKNVLNVYFTAGYPNINDTLRIADALESAGADMLEIGIPFSDPVADGPTIQESSTVALANGMTLEVLMDQLQALRSTVSIPVLLMGYFNPILQFGADRFCSACRAVGIDGLIIPDLPMAEYAAHYKMLFQQNELHNVFLISPNTPEERIMKIDEAGSGFIYMVSSSSITGARKGLEEAQIQYFERIQSMNLMNQRLIGFGISDHASFSSACQYASGAIIGSAFIKQLGKDPSNQAIEKFVKEIKGK